MRTEKEMFELIFRIAHNDDRIRVVGMEGSRTNANVPRDKFQDYDISYLVTDIQSFKEDDMWIDIFGKRIIMQMPENMILFPPELGNWYSYLMLFEDGNKMDLTLIPIEEADKYIKSDKLLQILLDKDNILPTLPDSTDEDYHVQKPSHLFFADCCNEFWFVSTYVAKGLWRKEILFANYYLNEQLRSCLFKMMEWMIGFRTEFSLSIGKNQKYLERYLDKADWKKLLQTYDNSSNESCWKSLFLTCELFEQTARIVATELGIEYQITEQDKVLNYLKSVYQDSRNN